MENHTTNITGTPAKEYYIIGWFSYRRDLADVDYDVLERLVIIFTVTSIPLNVLLLAMILKNPGSKTLTNISIILASMCVIDIIAHCITTVNQIYGATNEAGNRLLPDKMTKRILEISFAKFYISAFLLALITYAVIVKPLQYKTLSPKPRTMVLITTAAWLIATGLLSTLPLILDDRIMQTITVSFCWLTVFVIVIFYAKILNALRRRKKELKETLNAATTKQGLLVVKQNQKLAKVLLIYLLTMALMTLPIGTVLMLYINCTQCDHEITVKVILHLIPISFSLSNIYPVHWLYFTPQYRKEIKRLGSKLLKCSKQ